MRRAPDTALRRRSERAQEVVDQAVDEDRVTRVRDMSGTGEPYMLRARELREREAATEGLAVVAVALADEDGTARGSADRFDLLARRRNRRVVVHDERGCGTIVPVRDRLLD